MFKCITSSTIVNFFYSYQDNPASSVKGNQCRARENGNVAMWGQTFKNKLRNKTEIDNLLLNLFSVYHLLIK